ncbi:MAG: BTAD domain-containing putative transcriptional regulator [Actinomycetota bacterium]
MARDRIYVCGRLVIEIDGQRREGSLPGRQGRLAFAYLLLNRHRPIGRYELMDALWREETPADPETSLSAILSKVRKAVDPISMDGRSSLEVHIPDGFWLDLEAAEEALHRAESANAQQRWHEAWSPARVALHIAARGLLVGLDAHWLTPHRERIEELHLGALENYARCCLGIGGTEISSALRSARTLVERAGFRESGYRLLMRSLAADGNPAEGLRVYEQLRTRLREELGVSPGPETQEIHQDLLRACG